jgi:predicted type IV restriction endonuclease
MIQIKFPDYPYKIKPIDGKECIFDEFRKQWVRLTPEEWVRQNLLQYFIQELAIPASLIAVEKEIRLGELKKRFDILVYKDAKPWMMVECKEMDTPINESVLKQALNYNIKLAVQYIVVSNGKSTYAFELKDNGISKLNALPIFGID